jgi:hypothetical protein
MGFNPSEGGQKNIVSHLISGGMDGTVCFFNMAAYGGQSNVSTMVDFRDDFKGHTGGIVDILMLEVGSLSTFFPSFFLPFFLPFFLFFFLFFLFFFIFFFPLFFSYFFILFLSSIFQL